MPNLYPLRDERNSDSEDDAGLPVVRDEQARPRADGCALEWKVYGHDPWPGSVETLAAAGFMAGEIETEAAGCATAPMR